MHSKLVRTPGIYLTGFMGAGKTTIGLLLAEELGWFFVDLDDEIEAEQKTTISELFEQRGEEEFRRIEHDALRQRIRSVQYGKPTVLALGGGTLLQPCNYEVIEENGVSVWLDCSLDLLRRRVAGYSHRPLARDAARFERLYHERYPVYARADFRVEVTCDDPQVALKAILSLPIF
jgi:shikimate kinase